MNSAVQRIAIVLVALSFVPCANLAAAAEPDAATGAPREAGLAFIHTGFDNASPLHWEIDSEDAVQVYLVYDQERSSPNRANGHKPLTPGPPTHGHSESLIENLISRGRATGSRGRGFWGEAGRCPPWFCSR